MIYRRLYLIEKEYGHQTQIYEKKYKEIDDNNEFPAINHASEKDFKAFPNYKELCGFIREKDIYFDYQWLSGLPHGQLLALESIRTQKEEEYRRAMMLIVRYCIEVLKLTDFYLFKKNSTNTKSAINEAEEIIKKPFDSKQK